MNYSFMDDFSAGYALALRMLALVGAGGGLLGDVLVRRAGDYSMRRKLNAQLRILCRAAMARQDKDKTFGSGEKKVKPKPISLAKIPKREDA